MLGASLPVISELAADDLIEGDDLDDIVAEDEEVSA